MTRHTARRRAAGLAAAGALALTACGGGDDTGGTQEGDPLVVWTVEAQEPRIAVQRQIAEAFTEASGIEVELVPIEEGQATQLIQSAALSGELPDVISLLNLGFVRQPLLQPTVQAVAEDVVEFRVGRLELAEQVAINHKEGGCSPMPGARGVRDESAPRRADAARDAVFVELGNSIDGAMKATVQSANSEPAELPASGASGVV